MWGITWPVIDGIPHNHICHSQNGTFWPQRQTVILLKLNHLSKFPMEVIGMTILILLCTIVKEKLVGYCCSITTTWKVLIFVGAKFRGWHIQKLRFVSLKYRV